LWRSPDLRVAARLGPLLAALLLALAWTASRAGAPPPEPEGYRLDNYRSPTPATVAGRPALDIDAARRLWESKAAIFIDVLPAPRRPPGLPATAVWAPRPRLDIPGSIWLPDAGRGALNPAREAWFRATLERLTKGDHGAALVFYCLADCWMGWNATKRALEWGYTGARWLSEGTEGWEFMGLPLAAATPPGDAPKD
jgi:PQQ-dependent catabolism-associated CXXCW motif protein